MFLDFCNKLYSSQKSILYPILYYYILFDRFLCESCLEIYPEYLWPILEGSNLK